MKRVALALSLFVASIGALGVIRPEALVAIARLFQTPTGLYVAAGLRIVFGVALLVAASTSRAPAVISVLGIVVLVAGLIAPFVGPERVRAIVDWWSSLGPLVMRAWAAFALAFGCLLTWALRAKAA